MRDIQADVREFMTAFKQEMPGAPQWPSEQTQHLRVRLEAEEFCERLRDSGYGYDVTVDSNVAQHLVFHSERDGTEKSLPKSADAIIDEIYVLIGSLLAMGIDFWPLWNAVHAANMAKAGGPVVNGKVTKPEGWQAPDIEGLLRKQGWSE